MSTSENPSQLFIAIDASTTSIRAIIYDSLGRALATGRASVSFARLGRDGYEQDANDWWKATCHSIRDALTELPPARIQDLCALCIAHQRETVVATDEAGTPLAPAVLWMDSRCREDVEIAERNIGSVRLHAVSGKPACTTPSMYKLMYLFRHRPELREKSHIHDVHSFLSLKFTGRAVSSFASADPTGLMDMRKKCWSRSLTALVGIDTSRLPELVPPGYLIGPLTQQALESTGLPEQVFMYAGGGDGQLAGLGAGVIQKARGFLDLGTAVSCGTITDQYEIDTSFRTMHSPLPGRYCLETTLRGGMLTLWWLMESILGSTSRARDMLKLESEAKMIPATSEGLLTLPYWTGVMNPYWDDSARGAFIGLYPSHTPAHMYRSILEGIAMEQRLQLEGVRKAVGRRNAEIVVLGGGSRSNLWCQIFADVLGRPIRRCQTAEAPALGAAVLAAVSHGVYPSFEHAAEAMTNLEASFEPGPDAELYDQLYRDVYRGLYVDLQPRMKALAQVRERTTSGGNRTIPPPVSEN